MLDFLFSSELVFSKNWSRENRLGNLIDGVQELSAKVEKLLGEEQLDSWKQYQDKVRQLQNLNCQIEFERGFLIAAELLIEVMERTVREV